MDATQHRDAGADPTNPAAVADLGAFFRVMRLGDDPAPREQPGVGETSTADHGYVPPYHASRGPGAFYASHFGAHSPRSHAPTPPVDADAGHFSSQSHSSSTPSPSPSATHYQQFMSSAAPRLGAACFQPCDGNSSLNPNASAFQGTVRANQMDYHGESWQLPMPPMPEARYYLTLEQVRSRLRRRPLELFLLASPQTAAHVACLLDEGDDQVRRSVLDGVRRDVRGIMESDEGHAVLIALVRACTGRRDELQGIVQCLYKGNGFLTKHNHGLANLLKELVTALVPYAQLLVPFICWLLSERLMEQYKGAELLQYCFTTMSYEHSKHIIRFATEHIDQLLYSSFGSRCLAECLVYARNGELYALESIILERTIPIATGQYSNYFLQRAIEHGSEHLQVAIAERVAADVAHLSMDRFGSYVVEACFLLARTPLPLQRLLAAFLGLRGGELAELVQGSYSNYVVSKLLDAGRKHFPKETAALARQIDRLPASVQREMHARGVMMVVNKLIHKNHRVYATLNY